jgi:hypothetical protein
MAVLSLGWLTCVKKTHRSTYKENRPDGEYSHIVRGRERLRKTIGQAIGRDRGKWSLVGPNTCWVFCRID